MRLDQGRHQPGYNWHSPSIVPWAGQVLSVAAMLGLIAFAAGCSGFVSGQTSQITPPPTTYSISGTVSPAQGGSGATVTLSGAANATTTANSSGDYTFTGLANGTYAVTPSHTGYTVTPTSQTATINGADVAGINFATT